MKLLREESVLQEKLAEQEGAGKLASTAWYHADLTEQRCLPLPWSILERQSTHYCLFPLCSPMSFTLEKGRPLLCWIPHRNWAGGQSSGPSIWSEGPLRDTGHPSPSMQSASRWQQWVPGALSQCHLLPDRSRHGSMTAP